jgi:hypothetical protein
MAGGYIVFQLFGPGDPGTCSVLVFTSAQIPVNGPGDYVSGSFTPTVDGHYEWLATYHGDLYNADASHACGLEPVTVEPPSGLEEGMPPVGGEVYSINKLALLTPYLALLALLGALGVAFLEKKT